MNDDPSGMEPIGEDTRINALDQRLKALRELEDQRKRPAATGSDANYRMGNRVLAELIGGLVGGAFIGWVIDQVVGSSPWGLLVMLFMGVIVAFRNIIRISNRRPE